MMCRRRSLKKYLILVVTRSYTYLCALVPMYIPLYILDHTPATMARIVSGE